MRRLPPEMRAVVLIGSAALGDYVHGASDLDVAVVAPAPVCDAAALAAPLRHRELPCPARKLELVVYSAEQAAAPTRELDIELDLNTGPHDDRLLTELGDEPRHWYLIDLAIAHEHGRSLTGVPAAEAIGAPTHADLIDALLAGLDWSLTEEPDAAATVLNACRAWRYAETSEWLPKRAAGAWAAARFEDGILDTDSVAARAREALEAAR